MVDIRKILIILFVVLGFNQICNAQFRKGCFKIKHEGALKLYEKAVGETQYGQRGAINLLQQAIDSLPNYYQAHFLLGELLYKNLLDLYKVTANEGIESKIERLRTGVIFHFEEVINLCPQYQNHEAYFYLGEYYYKLNNYKKTEDYLNEFISHKIKTPEKLDKAKYYLEKTKNYFNLLSNPVPFKPISVHGVCTEDDEFLPLLSPDGEYMFFTFRSRKDIRYTYSSRPMERFVFSIRRNRDNFLTDTFSNKILMPEPFNGGRIQGAATITIDNKHIYITICEYERVGSTSYKNCDIYETNFVNGEWTLLKKLSNNINGNNTFEGQPSISADANVLFFASAREGGYGKLDIYKSMKGEKGKWGKASNLGPIINTPGNEKTPFIHSDSRTLYYASDAHFGLGGYDIFYSTYDNGNKIDSFYTKYSDGFWSHPANIGYPINTQHDEFGFIVSADGSKLYLSSNSLEGKGGIDIFSAELYKEARPIKVLFLKGRVLDEKGKPLTDVDIELKSIRTQQKTEGIVDDITGEYAVAVPIRDNENFIITARKEDRIYRSHYVNTNIEEFETPTIIDLEMRSIKKGEIFVIEDINFATSSWELNEVSEAVIKEFVIFLKDNPNLYIQLNGHTDNVGDADQNMTLSNNRAKVVSNYLILQDIKKYRVSYKGFGETRPIASNTTEEGRLKNRRTEFIILRK